MYLASFLSEFNTDLPGSDMTSSSPCVWLFPGQGSQAVGMGARLLKGYPSAERTFELAEDLSGQPILKAMLRGPETALAQTELLQPTLVALSCVYVDLMREAGISPHLVAGHSLGELPALYAADVLQLEDVLRLAVRRGQLMSQGPAGGMMSVKYCEQSLLEELIAKTEEGIVCLANINAPTQLIVSGDEAGLAALADRISQASGETQRLNVSGAWHSPLVGGAAYEFSKSLSLTDFADASCDVAMSSTARISTNGEMIKNTMLRQMSSPVLWHQTIDLIWGEGYRKYYEVGPGKVLKGLMRRIVPISEAYAFSGLETGTTLKHLLKQLTSRSGEVTS
ncbi:MAG TPA: [acyl-carrier-protein] S-malonyltransferase [Planctomycetaceae bacterium]|nr:[acyl-carrier-protein] S-malonyltransferase [Planctomycetaceae bacterium]